MEKILIPLSGGLDSTYLVYKNLKEGKIVQPVYIDIERCNENKSTIEKIQALKIYDKLLKEFGKKQILPMKILSIKLGGEYKQSSVWLKAIKEFIKENKIDEIQLGYIKDDIDENDPLEDFIKLNEKFESETNKKVTFPLLNIEKKDIIQILPSGISKLIFSCEFPKYERYFTNKGEEKLKIHTCGKCHPCQKDMILQLHKTKTFKQFKNIHDEDYKNFNELNKDVEKYAF